MSTRKALERANANIQESIGVRNDAGKPKLAPVANARDIGRRPDRSVGKIHIDQVTPDPEQPRIEFAEESIDRLAQSIRDKGQLSPIRVRWSEELQKWMIIFGERRWRATKKAGLDQINCIFCEKELSRSEILEEQIIENLHREDLDAVAQAKAFSTLMHLNDWTATQVAEALRINKSTVSRMLSILKLPDDVIERVEKGELSARSAAELARIKNDDARREVGKQAAEGKFTHQDVARKARQRSGKKAIKKQTYVETFQGRSGIKFRATSKRDFTLEELGRDLKEFLADVQQRQRQQKAA